MQQHDDKIARLQKELAETVAAKAASEAHPIPEADRYVAELLHEKICKHSHTDYCDWMYDKGAWTESSRVNYLQRAGKLLKLIPNPNKIKTIIDIMYGV